MTTENKSVKAPPKWLIRNRAVCFPWQISGGYYGSGMQYFVAMRLIGERYASEPLFIDGRTSYRKFKTSEGPALRSWHTQNCFYGPRFIVMLVPREWKDWLVGLVNGSNEDQFAKDACICSIERGYALTGRGLARVGKLFGFIREPKKGNHENNRSNAEGLRGQGDGLRGG